MMTSYPKTNDKKILNRITELKTVYSIIPPTVCKSDSCADWCCSKLDQAKDVNGNFMSLPLIYNIEYYAIIEYIKKNFAQKEQKIFFDLKKESTKCVFRKSDHPAGCMIYPVRPFSCRVYGRRTPDYFWGIEYPEGCAQSIYCHNCEPENKLVEDEFINKSYRKIWREIENLSAGLQVVPPGYEKIFEDITGLREILILGWIERNELLSKDKQWFKKHLENWWGIYSNLL